MLARYLRRASVGARKGQRERDRLEVDWTHRAKVAVRHVDGVLHLFERAAAESGGGRIAIVEEADLVDAVELTRLSWDVGGRKVESSKEVFRARPVHLLGNDLSVEVLVELRRDISVRSRPGGSGCKRTW